MLAPKFTSMLTILGVFFGFFFVLFIIGRLLPERVQRVFKYLVFLVPALIALLVALVIPAFRSIYLSMFNARSTQFVGLDNYVWAFTNPDILIVLRNTVVWVVVAPTLAVTFGLVIAALVDRMRRESFAKSLIFMPMAISFVGASIIFKFIYEYRAPEFPQIGLLNQIVISLGFNPPNWLLTIPLNTFLLIMVMVWIQTGFAMVILSAAIKAIPVDVVEASMMDGASGLSRFFRVTVPMIRGTLIVVFATITIGTLKIFDIVRTMTGGNFDTSVLANEMYTQTFRQLDYGTGSTLAVLLFIGVLPLVIINTINLRREQGIR